MNDIFLENLADRLFACQPSIGELQDYERFIAENDLEGAESFVRSLESKLYTDDGILKPEEDRLV